MAVIVLFVFLFLLGLIICFQQALNRIFILRTNRPEDRFLQVSREVRIWIDTLKVGLLPTFEMHESMARLPKPWGPLLVQTIQDLRTRGAPLIPTLSRFKELSEQMRSLLIHAKSECAQAKLQSMALLGMIPVFGGMLFLLLEDLDPVVWIVSNLLAFSFAFVGFRWMTKMIQTAMWAGLKGQQRQWILLNQLLGERVVSELRGGTPPDEAWLKATDFARRIGLGLKVIPALSIWDEDALDDSKTIQALLRNTNIRLKRLLHVSIIEGRPCVENIENLLEASRKEVRIFIESGVNTLGVKALKPLFIFCAPSIIFLIGVALISSLGEVQVI